MSYTTLPSPIIIPELLRPNGFRSFDAMTSLDHRRGWTIRIPKTGTLRKAAFRMGGVSSAQDLRVSFQDVDATGNPDGTEDQYRVVPLASVTANTWLTTGIVSSDGTDGGTTRSVTRGDVMAVVMRFDSIAGNVTPTMPRSFLETNFPYVNTSNNAGASWTKNISGIFVDHYAGVALEYVDGTYALIDGALPLIDEDNFSYAAASTPDEHGLIFTPPVGIRVAGLMVFGDFDDEAVLKLYDTDGSTVLESLTIDPDFDPNTTGGWFQHRFATSVELAAGGTYRATVLPTSTTIRIQRVSVASAAVMAALPLGADWHQTARTDAGAWSQTTTIRPLIGLIVDGIEAGAAPGAGQTARVYIG